MNMQDLRDWYDDLELRSKLEENQSIVVVGLLGVILFSIILVTCQMTGGRGASSPNKATLAYFDITNQSIRLVDHDYSTAETSPLEGTADVFLAAIFSCEECEKGAIKDGMSIEDLKSKGLFIGWLEKIDPEASEEFAAFGEGRLYRSLEKDRWYKPSDAGYEVLSKRAYEKCERARRCWP